MANHDKCVFCGEDLRFFHSYSIRCGDVSCPCCKDCAGELAELSEEEQCRRALRLGLVEQQEKLEEAGYRISNVDVTMIAQRPKLKPHIPQMMENIASDLGIDVSRVNVKATTEEQLGFTGSGEGMSCHAVCLLEE